MLAVGHLTRLDTLRKLRTLAFRAFGTLGHLTLLHIFGTLGSLAVLGAESSRRLGHRIIAALSSRRLGHRAVAVLASLRLGRLVRFRAVRKLRTLAAPSVLRVSALTAVALALTALVASMIVLADSRSRVTGRIDCRVVGVALGHSGVNTVIRRRDVQLAVVNDNFLRLDALLATGYGERAAVHGELRLGVHALAAGFHDIGAPDHGRLHVGAQGVIGRLDLRVAASQTQIRGRLEALIARFHGEGATVDGHKPAGRILVVARLHTVAAGRDGEGAIGHLHAVLAAQSVLLGDHGNRAARDHEVVLGVHAMAIVAFDAQRAGAVDGQVGLRVQRRVGLVLPFRKLIARTVGQRVLCAVGQGHEYLVSLLDVQRRPRLVANRRAAKHDLHLVLAIGVHHQRPGR